MAVVEQRYLEPEIETASRDSMRALQLPKVLSQVQHAYADSAFYRRKFDEAGVRPEQVKTLEDLRLLPFTSKDELKRDQAENPLWGSLLAVPFDQISRVHFTSATTGRPVAMLDTKQDWYGFYHQYARSLYAYGVRQSDMVMAAFGYGPYIGFWSGFYGAEELGALMYPAGGLSTEQRLEALRTYPITVLGSTPSYAIYLAEEARKRGIDLAKETKIRITWHTGEPGASIPATKQKIQEAFGAKTFDLPGLTEISPWGFECDAQCGLVHVHEDYQYVEVLDIDTGEPVGPGQTGELIFTSLYRKAMPLLRYRTRDLVKITDRQCPCGRTLLAFEGGVLARLDDMRKIRGIIVYPSRIEEIVRASAEVDEFRIIIHRVAGLDDILVRIDPVPGMGDEAREALRNKLAHQLQLGLGIRTSVELVEPGSLPRWDHKAKRVEDQRTEVPF